jgi:hypothetical protein
MARKPKRPKFYHYGPAPCGCYGWQYMTEKVKRNAAEGSEWRVRTVPQQYSNRRW